MVIQGLVGMTEAAERLGVSNRVAAKRALENAGVPIVKALPKAFFVAEGDLERLVRDRAERGIDGKGRPRKPKEAAQ